MTYAVKVIITKYATLLVEADTPEESSDNAWKLMHAAKATADIKVRRPVALREQQAEALRKVGDAQKDRGGK